MNQKNTSIQRFDDQEWRLVVFGNGRDLDAIANDAMEQLDIASKSKSMFLLRLFDEMAVQTGDTNGFPK